MAAVTPAAIAGQIHQEVAVRWAVHGCVAERRDRAGQHPGGAQHPAPGMCHREDGREDEHQRDRHAEQQRQHPGEQRLGVGRDVPRVVAKVLLLWAAWRVRWRARALLRPFATSARDAAM